MIRFGIDARHRAQRIMVGLLKNPLKINAKALKSLVFIPFKEYSQEAVVA